MDTAFKYFSKSRYAVALIVFSVLLIILAGFLIHFVGIANPWLALAEKTHLAAPALLTLGCLWWLLLKLDSKTGLAPADEPFPLKTYGCLLWCLAGVFIFWRYLAAEMSIDPAVVGRMGMGALNGLWPIYFADQGFMGSLDAYLAAPLYKIWGPSVLILNLFPPLLYVGSILFINAIVKRMFNFAGQFLALSLMLFPPAVTALYAAVPRTHYAMAMFLGAWLMYLSASLAPRQHWGCLRPLAWGGLAGILVWTHTGAVTVAGGCALYLLLINWRKCLKGLAWFILGAAIGLLPVWIYTLLYEFPPVVYEDLLLRKRILFFLLYGIKIIFGLDAFSSTQGFWPALENILCALLLALLCAGLMALLKNHNRSPWRPALLPVLVVILSLIATFVGGRRPEHATDGRYYLLMFLGLPFCWAALGQSLSKYKWTVPLLATALIIINISGWQTRQLLNLKDGFYLKQEQTYIEQAKLAKATGLTSMYVTDSVLAFYLGPQIWAAIPPDDTLFRYAQGILQVEASFNPGFWEDVCAGSMAWLGLPHVKEESVLHSFAQPDWAARPISLNSAQLYDLKFSKIPPVLNDLNLSTGIDGPPRADAQPSPAEELQGFIMELPEAQTVGALFLIPFHCGYLPDHIRLEVAGPDGVFTLVRETANITKPVYLSGPHPVIRERFPRLEAYFEPRPVKYFKVIASSSPYQWSVREIMLRGPALTDAATPVDWSRTAEFLLQSFDELKPNFIYADPWPGAIIRTQRRFNVPPLTIAEVQKLPAQNLRSYHFPHWVEAEPGQALLVFNADAPEAEKRLNLEQIQFSKRETPGVVWFQLQSSQTGQQLPGAQLKIEANSQSQHSPWDFLQIDLPQPQNIQWISLGSNQIRQFLNWPERIEVFVPDQPGQSGIKGRLAGPLAFTGQMILPAPYHKALYCLENPILANRLDLKWVAPVSNAGQKIAVNEVEIYSPKFP